MAEAGTHAAIEFFMSDVIAKVKLVRYCWKCEVKGC